MPDAPAKGRSELMHDPASSRGATTGCTSGRPPGVRDFADRYNEHLPNDRRGDFGNVAGNIDRVQSWEWSAQSPVCHALLLDTTMERDSAVGSAGPQREKVSGMQALASWPWGGKGRGGLTAEDHEVLVRYFTSDLAGLRPSSRGPWRYARTPQMRWRGMGPSRRPGCPGAERECRWLPSRPPRQSQCRASADTSSGRERREKPAAPVTQSPSPTAAALRQWQTPCLHQAL